MDEHRSDQQRRCSPIPARRGALGAAARATGTTGATAAAVAELILSIFWIGLRPQLSDGPLVVAKSATEGNAEDALAKVSFAYHDAQLYRVGALAPLYPPMLRQGA